MLDQLPPDITAALTLLVTAALGGATTLIWSWVKLQRKELQLREAELEVRRQAALGAVCEVEAECRPSRDLTNEQKHARARERIALRLPNSIRPAAAVELDELISEAVDREKSKPTSDPPERDTVPDRPRPPKIPRRSN